MTVLGRKNKKNSKERDYDVVNKFILKYRV